MRSGRKCWLYGCSGSVGDNRDICNGKTKGHRGNLPPSCPYSRSRRPARKGDKELERIDRKGSESIRLNAALLQISHWNRITGIGGHHLV